MVETHFIVSVLHDNAKHRHPLRMMLEDKLRGYARRQANTPRAMKITEVEVATVEAAGGEGLDYWVRVLDEASPPLPITDLRLDAMIDAVTWELSYCVNWSTMLAQLGGEPRTILHSARKVVPIGPAKVTYPWVQVVVPSPDEIQQALRHRVETKLITQAEVDAFVLKMVLEPPYYPSWYPSHD